MTYSRVVVHASIVLGDLVPLVLEFRPSCKQVHIVRLKNTGVELGLQHFEKIQYGKLSTKM